MANASRLLERLLALVGDSADYFVSGSLSFLPLTGNYRQPEHDVDAALSREVYEAGQARLRGDERVHVLTLAEVAVAGRSPLARVLAPQTGFVHLETPDGLLDLSCYRRKMGRLVFSLGAGLTLSLPAEVEQRVRLLDWRGIPFRAGPPELAFLPKAVWYLATRTAPEKERPDAKTLEDLRRLQRVVDWDFMAFLLQHSRSCWLNRPLPKGLRQRLDPFCRHDVLSLRGHEIGY